MKHPARAALATAAMLAAAAAASVAAVAIPASASAAPASSKIVATTPVFPPTLVNYFFGELNPPNGSANWEWASTTATENFANATSRAVVTGNITLGSNNGLAVGGKLGVCYQQGAGRSCSATGCCSTSPHRLASGSQKPSQAPSCLGLTGIPLATTLSDFASNRPRRTSSLTRPTEARAAT